MVRHTGPSSGSKDGRGGEVEDDCTSDSSRDEQQIDSDYVDTKETYKAKGKQRTTERLHPRADNKTKEEAEQAKDHNPVGTMAVTPTRK